MLGKQTIADLGKETEPAPDLSEDVNIEVSIVMPCLNEADTLESCVKKAQESLRKLDIAGEIIVADNGSTDGSPLIAERLGVRVIHVTEKGYGSALMSGIRAARGKYIIMGDADGSYDFLDVPKFVEKLRTGFDLVQGCRLSSGGGQIMPGAMPFLHRWFGNPMFSMMIRRMYRAPIHDVYCGLRGFTKDLYERLDLRCIGMEFATEMVIKSSFDNAKIAEIPVTLRPDGRKSHGSHLRTFRDGWRTMRFFLMLSPRWLFLYPGALFILLGCLGYGIAFPGFSIKGISFDVHTLLVSSLAILLGFQSILFAIFSKTFAISEGLMPESSRMNSLLKVINLERGLIGGFASMVIGLGLIMVAVNQWRLVNFGDLDYPTTMRWVTPGVTLTALGFQIILSSFLISILRMRRR